MVKLQRQHSVPVPCGLQVLHHSSQQSGVGIVGYKFRSTNVHGFIFGPRSLEIGALHVPYSVRMLKCFLIRAAGDLRPTVKGMCSVT